MISNSGIALIKWAEGFRATPYTDGSRKAIGYGHNIKPGENLTHVTEAQAHTLLLSDAQIAEDALLRCVRVSLSQPQLDALISLVYNWGATNFCSSILLRRLNAGDYVGAAARLREHPITQKGVVLSALVARRAAEADLFLSGTDTGGGGGGDIPVDDGGTGGGNPLDTLFDEPGLDEGPSMTALVLLGAALVVLVILLSD